MTKWHVAAEVVRLLHPASHEFGRVVAACRLKIVEAPEIGSPVDPKPNTIVNRTSYLAWEPDDTGLELTEVIWDAQLQVITATDWNGLIYPNRRGLDTLFQGRPSARSALAFDLRKDVTFQPWSGVS